MDVLEQSRYLPGSCIQLLTTFCVKSIFWNVRKSYAVLRHLILKMRLYSRRVKILPQSVRGIAHPAPDVHTEKENHTVIPACQKAVLRTWESCGKSLNKSVIPNSKTSSGVGISFTEFFMGTAIVIFGLAIIVLCAILSIRKRIKYGSSCCGGHDAAPKKIKVSDKNKAHYPYTYTLTVEGMHCSNCARRVENALNSKEGVWASVKLENNSVIVRSKNPMKWEDFSPVITKAGYTLIESN